MPKKILVSLLALYGLSFFLPAYYPTGFPGKACSGFEAFEVSLMVLIVNFNYFLFLANPLLVATLVGGTLGKGWSISTGTGALASMVTWGLYAMKAEKNMALGPGYALWLICGLCALVASCYGVAEREKPIKTDSTVTSFFLSIGHIFIVLIFYC